MMLITTITFKDINTMILKDMNIYFKRYYGDFDENIYLTGILSNIDRVLTKS